MNASLFPLSCSRVQIGALFLFVLFSKKSGLLFSWILTLICEILHFKYASAHCIYFLLCWVSLMLGLHVDSCVFWYDPLVLDSFFAFRNQMLMVHLLSFLPQIWKWPYLPGTLILFNGNDIRKCLLLLNCHCFLDFSVDNAWE